MEDILCKTNQKISLRHKHLKRFSQKITTKNYVQSSISYTSFVNSIQSLKSYMKTKSCDNFKL